jgi:two-component system, LytTR family, sensor kinase
MAENTGSPGRSGWTSDSSAWNPRVAVWVMAIPLGLIDGLHGYVHAYSTNAAIATLRVLTDWIAFFVLIWMVPRLARLVPIDVPGWRKNALAQLGVVITVQYVHFSLLAVLAHFFIEGWPTARALGLLGDYPRDVLAYWIIAGYFYAARYHSEFHKREMAAAKLATSLAEARLEMLQRQLAPHFLFNCLNAISALALQGNQKAVAEMLSVLGDLLRVTLDEQHGHTVPLASELAFLGGYLRLQKIRFSDRLDVRLDIAPDTVGALVPIMILQPLVENAIEHGMSSESRVSTIAIRTRMDHSKIRLSVSDTGPGFRSNSATFVKGIGLSNTESRLKQLYGGEHEIEYARLSGAGASVTISIPFQEDAAAGRSEVRM